MPCTRCRGHCVREWLNREQSRWQWRCYNCGERVDRLILLHRAECAAAEAMRREAEQRDLLEWSAWFRRMPVASGDVLAGRD